MRRGCFNHGIHGTHEKLGLSQGLSPTASHNVVRLSTKSGEMTSLEQMGRHPFGVALFIAHFDVFFHFPLYGKPCRDDDCADKREHCQCLDYAQYRHLELERADKHLLSGFPIVHSVSRQAGIPRRFPFPLDHHKSWKGCTLRHRPICEVHLSHPLTEPTGSDLIATVDCHSRFSLS